MLKPIFYYLAYTKSKSLKVDKSLLRHHTGGDFYCRPRRYNEIQVPAVTMIIASLLRQLKCEKCGGLKVLDRKHTAETVWQMF